MSHSTCRKHGVCHSSCGALDLHVDADIVYAGRQSTAEDVQRCIAGALEDITNTSQPVTNYIARTRDLPRTKEGLGQKQLVEVRFAKLAGFIPLASRISLLVRTRSAAASSNHAHKTQPLPIFATQPSSPRDVIRDLLHAEKTVKSMYRPCGYEIARGSAVVRPAFGLI